MGAGYCCLRALTANEMAKSSRKLQGSHKASSALRKKQRVFLLHHTIQCHNNAKRYPPPLNATKCLSFSLNTTALQQWSWSHSNMVNCAFCHIVLMCHIMHSFSHRLSRLQTLPHAFFKLNACVLTCTKGKQILATTVISWLKAFFIALWVSNKSAVEVL